jgi:hypothetical protein
MPLYEVWAEGYAATGEHGTASYVGSVEASSFEEACRLLHDPAGYGALGEVGGRPAYWGCRLFDNEADARKSFG